MRLHLWGGLAAVLALAPAADAGYLYYGLSGVQNSVSRSDTDGTGHTNLVGPSGFARDLDVSTAAGRMYWADATNPGGTNRVYAADLDGTNQVVLTTVTSGVVGVGVDVSTGRIYFGSINGLYRVNADGTGQTQLVSGFIFGDVEVVGGKVYWSSLGNIRRSNLDGTNVETVVTGQSSIVGLDVSASLGRMFWADQNTGKVQSANLDGTGVTTIATNGSRGVTVDDQAGRVYWGTSSYVRSANLDGTNAQLFTHGYGNNLLALTFVPEGSSMVAAPATPAIVLGLLGVGTLLGGARLRRRMA